MVVPMLDEIATFFAYIHTGHYFNTIELVDANNHVLNSFFGHQFYRWFGDHFFLFRIASILSFPVYFFALKCIVQESIPKWSGVLVFLSLICIPWVFEYFAYSRGYAMALGGYFTAIACVIRWNRSGRLVHFACILVSLLIAVASSLTYLMPSMLLFGLMGVLLVLNRKMLQQKWYFFVGAMCGWLLALIPFVQYSFELKEVGALWWGNQDGLWESTGKSLSKLVLFTESSLVLYVLCFLLLFGMVSFIRSWIEKGLWDCLKETDALVLILLVGSLTGIVLMRYMFEVNYPMDRVGMYLVPLFILFLGIHLSKYRWTQYGLIALVFFPISFVFHLNNSTSIFSPEDRIPTYLSNQIKESITDETALSAEYVSHMSYAYSCRNDEKVHMAYTAEKDESYLGDYHINWLGVHKINGYSSLIKDPDSRTNFTKRDVPWKKELIVDTVVSKTNTSEMYFTVFEENIDHIDKSKLLQLEISGDMEFNEPTRAFNVVSVIKDANDNRSSTSSPYFNWYFSDRKDVNFSFIDRPVQLKPEDKTVSIFLLNGDLKNIAIESIRIRIYQLVP